MIECTECELPCRPDERWVAEALCGICRETSKTVLRVHRDRLARERRDNGRRRDERAAVQARRISRDRQLAARLAAVEARLIDLNGYTRNGGT